MSKLASLRIRVDHLVLGIAAVAVLVGGIVTWSKLRRDAAHEQQVSEGEQQLRDQPGTRKQMPRFIKGYYAGAPKESNELGEGVAQFQPPPATDPGDLGPAEALDSFQKVIAELEQAVEDERRLSKRERAEYYNRATGSFTAMSAWVDPSNADERAMMNDAHAQMISLMRELDIQPPKHDPDYNPLRR